MTPPASSSSFNASMIRASGISKSLTAEATLSQGDATHHHRRKETERPSKSLYTGVTRGKRLVIMLGQKKAVAMAVKNTSGRLRWSKLRDWLATF
jgi:hypothetical protein